MQKRPTGDLPDAFFLFGTSTQPSPKERILKMLI